MWGLIPGASNHNLSQNQEADAQPPVPLRCTQFCTILKNSNTITNRLDKQWLPSHYISGIVAMYLWASACLGLILHIHKLLCCYSCCSFGVYTIIHNIFSHFYFGDSLVLPLFFLNIWHSVVPEGSTKKTDQRLRVASNQLLVPREPTEVAAFLLSLEFESKSFLDLSSAAFGFWAH